ncbi:hypothetical protein [Nonomuraea sp. NPDC005650]|uniref:hypothetical protein n=1 Tax=Nonomuraea sp. NPDC005650 TaxID=3157045 RepID=UPI0033A060FA
MCRSASRHPDGDLLEELTEAVWLGEHGGSLGEELRAYTRYPAEREVVRTLGEVLRESMA